MKYRLRISRNGGIPASFLRSAFALATLLALGACASTPEPPNQAIQAAELAIAAAEQARITDSSSVELGSARSKLREARVAVNDENMVLAERLADESRVDAELASAKAELSRARVVNEKTKAGTETLKQEMQRNEEVQQ